MREELRSPSRKRLEIRLDNLNRPWAEALHLGVRCCFPKRHVEPGDDSRGFYFLAGGSVRLSYVGAGGQERSSLYMGPNCLFNEIPALAPSLPSCASFCCEEAVEAWRFDTALLEDVAFASQYPQLMVNLTQSLARKASLFFYHLSEIVFFSSTSQVCALLLQLAEARGPRMTQSEVAALLGLHPTTVARTIRTLRDAGILGKFTKMELQVLNMARLRELAGGAKAPVASALGRASAPGRANGHGGSTCGG